MIYAVGLGANKGDITARGIEKLKLADRVILKTKLCEGAKFITGGGYNFEDLDFIYEESEDFDSLNESIASKLLSYGEENIAYLVPYSPENDLSVKELLKHTDVEIISAVSHAGAFDRQVCTDFVVLSAYALPDADTFCPPNMPLLIYDIDSLLLAGEVKLYLLELYSEESGCIFMHGGERKEIKLYELDRQKNFDYTSKLIVLPMELKDKSVFSYYDLIAILKRLRGVGGCPWDRAQTHESIKANLIEESYELVEGIEEGDADKMMEESGDVLLQAVFHAAIANEENEFTYRDMLNNLCGKLIFRHSHIFGEDRADSSSGALDVWEKNKLIEKNQNSLYEVLRAIPKQFPALMRLRKTLSKIKKAGEDMNFNADFDKFLSAPSEEGFAEVMFAAVSAMLNAKLETETVLQSSIDGYIERFIGK